MYLINFMNRSVYILYIAYIPCMYHLYSLKQTFFKVCEWVISVVIFILFYFLFCEAQVWNVNGDRWNQRGFFFLFSFCRIQSYASSLMNRELRNHSAASWFGFAVVCGSLQESCWRLWHASLLWWEAECRWLMFSAI